MRKLASIQYIAEKKPIEGADAIEAVRVNDWWCVSRVGEFEVGDLCCYHEIDSLLPMNETYAFLANRGTRKSELEDGTIVEGYRLKSIKLKGQISQGLALPFSVVGGKYVKPEQVHHDSEFVGKPYIMHDNTIHILEVGEDVTAILGVHKYEPPMNAQLRDLARGNFPSFLRKSDQERCQNIRREIWDAYVANDTFEVSVKLDGSSMTVFIIDDEQAAKWGTEARFGVCSRNLELKETDDNAFWKMANTLQLKEKMLSLVSNEPNVKSFALQGELLATNIQGNFEGVTKPEFYVYNVFDIELGEYAKPTTAQDIVKSLGLNYVPLKHWADEWKPSHITLRELFPSATQDTIIQDLLDYADGPSALGGKFREGLVFKRVDGKFSFKAISNNYLISEK